MRESELKDYISGMIYSLKVPGEIDLKEYYIAVEDFTALLINNPPRGLTTKKDNS